MAGLEWLDEIERRANMATEGPWEYRPDIHGVVKKGTDITICSNALPVDEEFIAHAREDVPRLCRAIRELLEDLEGVANLFDEYGMFWEASAIRTIIDKRKYE